MDQLLAYLFSNLPTLKSISSFCFCRSKRWRGKLVTNYCKVVNVVSEGVGRWFVRNIDVIVHGKKRKWFWKLSVFEMRIKILFLFFFEILFYFAIHIIIIETIAHSQLSRLVVVVIITFIIQCGCCAVSCGGVKSLIGRRRRSDPNLSPDANPTISQADSQTPFFFIISSYLNLLTYLLFWLVFHRASSKII